MPHPNILGQIITDIHFILLFLIFVLFLFFSMAIMTDMIYSIIAMQ